MKLQKLGYLNLGFLMILVGCKHTDFQPYEHMSMIMNITSQEEFEANRDYILSHTSEELRTDIESRLNVNILLENYSLVEQQINYQTDRNAAKFIGQYYMTTAIAEYSVLTCFEYNDNILVDYDITIVDITPDFE